MIIIIDSGSTKSDWVILDRGEPYYLSTPGLNPYFHDEESVYTTVSACEELLNYSTVVEKVFFYGAGCSSESMCRIIEVGLSNVFVNAEIIVEHDLLASAIATYTEGVSISCILGTGSNACLYDGVNLQQAVPALSYILGDEGAGTYFGKKLLADYLYGLLPKHLHAAFCSEYSLDKDAIFHQVYKESTSNVFLASFIPFLAKFSNEPYVKTMIKEGFLHFNRIHVCSYENYKSIPTNYIGSVAFLFRDVLEEACKELGVNFNHVLQKPIDGLVEYHKRQLSLTS